MNLEDKKIVIIGGGNGTSTVLKSLNNSGANLTALLSMADDGGSTGRLRREYGVSALGDIRQVLASLASSENSKEMFSYRFGSGELEGHSFGNLFLSAIERSSGSLYKAIEEAKKILEVEENILPITDDKPQLICEFKDEKISGVYKIARTPIQAKNSKFYLEPKSKITKKATDAILEADLVIIAPGNFYCSILPALMVDGCNEALIRTKAKLIFISNLINFENHTKGYKISDYLSELNRLAKINNVDIVIANETSGPNNLSGEDMVVADNIEGINVIKTRLLNEQAAAIEPNDKIAGLRSKYNHDSESLYKNITQLFKEL